MFSIGDGSRKSVREQEAIHLPCFAAVKIQLQPSDPKSDAVLKWISEMGSHIRGTMCILRCQCSRTRTVGDAERLPLRCLTTQMMATVFMFAAATRSIFFGSIL